MLTTDTTVKGRTNLLTFLYSHLHQLANTCLVKLSKWIALVDLSIIVSIQELTGIITGETECHLSQVVCTEAEELSLCCNLISGQCCTRNLDHSTNFVLHLNTCCCNLSVSCCNNDILNILKLFNLTNEWDHDLWLNCPIRMFLLYVDCCTDNSTCLHLSNLRICYSKTTSTMTHHWVELVK